MLHLCRYLTSLLAALDPPRGLVMVLEGGYNLTSIALDAEQCVKSLINAAASHLDFLGHGQTLSLSELLWVLSPVFYMLPLAGHCNK
jgi:hypothetical protein